MAIPYDPSYRGSVSLARELELDRDLQHDASASAAIVAVELISSARLALKLDSVYTEYSAQYLVDRACPGTKLTVKDCLEFALKEGGIPKVDGWLPLGTKIKLPSSCTPALVSMKGQVVEAKDIKEASDLLMDQPVAAKLHVFTPQIEVGDGIYCGTSGEATCYVGLRDVIIVGVEKIQGKDIATVKLWYKNRFRFVKVALSRWFMMAGMGTHSNDSRNIETTFLLVDYCAPRLSV